MHCAEFCIFLHQEAALVAPGAPPETFRRPGTLKLSEHLGTSWPQLPQPVPQPVPMLGSPIPMPVPEMFASSSGSASRPPPGLELPQTLLESFHAKPRLSKRMKRMALVNLIRTPEGAEEIVSKLDSATHSFCAELVAAILPDLPNLACDPHGIQVLSKLVALPALSQELRCKLAQRLQGSILKLTKDS